MGDFRLSEIVLREVMKKQFDASKIRLGDAIKGARRGINWQYLDNCKKVLSTLYPDFHLEGSAKSWSAVKQLFEDRNIIVHAAGEETRVVEEPDFAWVEDQEGGRFEVTGTSMSEETFDIIRRYSPQQIEDVLDDVLAMAEALHRRLFSRYEPDG